MRCFRATTMSRGLDIDRHEDRSGYLRHDTNVVRSPRIETRDPARRSSTVPTSQFRLPGGPEREDVFARRGHFRLRDTESHTLVTVGSFRVVFERDLLEGPYRGDAARLVQDIRSLRAQGLIDRRTIASNDSGRVIRILALTEHGAELLEAQRDRDEGERDQAVHHGWRKPAEVIHDASLCRMYQVEAAAIEDRGGRITRVVLGDELKQTIYSVANRQPTGFERDTHRALEQAASAVGVRTVNGHLEFPDVRIEYETAAGERTRVDLELVTAAYHGAQIAAKQAAGFTLYSAHGSPGRGIHSLGGRGGSSHEHFVSNLLSL